MQTLKSSYEHDAAAMANASPWAANIKAMVRPALTFLGVALWAALGYALLQGDLQGCMDGASRAELVAQMASDVSYYTGLMVGWWFTDRVRRTNRGA